MSFETESDDNEFLITDEPKKEKGFWDNLFYL